MQSPASCSYRCSSHSGPVRMRISARRGRPASVQRRAAVQPIVATLVGPDPRWAVQQPSSSKPGPALQGKEVEEAAMWRCIELHRRLPNGVPLPPSRWTAKSLEEAYVRCGEVTSEYAKTFYLGTQLMTPLQAKSIWAIYVWCRRTDELVDGPNASKITPKVGHVQRDRSRGTDTRRGQSTGREV